MSATIAECRILNCRSRNPNGSCREVSININGLKMCSRCNTKEPFVSAKASPKTDYSPLSILRSENP